MTIDEQVKAADAKIAELEAALRVTQEHRRELVKPNKYKCNHEFTCNDWRKNCLYCGAKL
jgi:hypothetical protein